MAVNFVCLEGTLGKDPEQNQWKDITFTNFTMAALEDEKKDLTTWYKVTAFGELGDTIMRMVTKGDPVIVSGSIKHQSYKNKNDEWKTQPTITAKSVTKLGLKTMSSDEMPGGASKPPESKATNSSFGSPETAPQDDEIPF